MKTQICLNCMTPAVVCARQQPSEMLFEVFGPHFVEQAAVTRPLGYFTGFGLLNSVYIVVSAYVLPAFDTLTCVVEKISAKYHPTVDLLNPLSMRPLQNTIGVVQNT